MARSIIDNGRSLACFSGVAWARAGAGTAFVFAMLALPMPTWAFDYEAKLDPFAGNLSPWGGSGAVNPISIDQFIGAQWDKSFGPVDLSLKACADLLLGEVCVGYGVDGQASTSGRLGFDFGLHASAGSVQVGLPMTVGLDISPGVRGTSNPNPVISFPADGFTIEAGGFSYLGAHGVDATGAPFLNTYAPTFDAHLNAVAELDFSASGHICYLYCLGGDVSEHLGGSQSLFNIGPVAGGGYSASVIGLGDVTLPNEFDLGTNLAKLFLNVPNVNTVGGYDAATQTLTSTGKEKVFGLSLDVAALAGNLLPILYPFVGNHDLGPIGSYDLLSASIGVFLSYVENFVAFVKDVVVGFVFSDPVSVNGSGPTLGAVLGHGGEPLEIAPIPGSNGFSSIGVVPVFFVQAGVHHEPSLDLTLGGELKVLDFSIAGHDFGPVADPKFEVDLAKFDLPSFDTVSDYIPIVGMPFNIYPGGPPIIDALCPTCLPSTHHEFREVRHTCPVGDLGIPLCFDPAQQVNDIWLVESTCPLSTLPSDCPNAFLLSGTTSLSAFTDENRNDLIFTNASSLNFPPGSQGPMLSADYASNWLSEHGVTAEAPPFPAFPPFQFPFEITEQVPEPGTIGLALVGMIAFAFARRRPRALAVRGIA